MASRLDFSQIRSLYIGTSSGTTVDTNNLIVSGNVGIGTTAPGYKLEVVGNTAFTGNRSVFYDTGGGNFQIKASAGGWSMGYFFQGSSGTYRGGWGAFGGNNDLSYLWAGDAYDAATMVVQGGQGNVGIGTTSPAQKLDVSGNAKITGNLYVSTSNATGGGIVLADDGDIVDLNDGFATHRFSYGLRITNANGAGSTVIQLANGVVGAGSTYFNSGNVGIGTTAPNFLLTLDKNSSYTLGLLNSNIGTPGQYTGLTFGYTGTSYQKGAVYFISKDGAGRGDLVFALNNVANSANVSTSDEIMRISSGGNVGISTTSPGAGLDVQNSNGTFRQKNFTTMVTNNLAANGTQARRFEIARLSIDYNDWNSVGTLEVELHERYYSQGLKKRYSIYYGYVSSSGCNLVEMSGQGDNQFRVTIGPEVVISGDIRYIPVYVDVRYYSQVNAVLRTTRYLTTSNPPEQSNIWVNSEPAGVDISDFTPDSTVYVGNIIGGNSVFTTGNVGIGTTSPVSKLHVQGSGPVLVAQSTDDAVPARVVNLSSGISTIGFQANGSANSYNVRVGCDVSDFIAYTSNSERLRITSAGNVGIGTTSPGSKLNIVGGFIRVQGTDVDQFFLEGIRTGTSTTVRIYDNSSTAYYDSYSNMIFRANQLGGSGGYIGFFGGKVGIGTGSPTATLTIGTNEDIQSTNGIALGVDQSSLEFVHATFNNGFGSKFYSVDSGGGVTSLRLAVRADSTSWGDAITVIAGTSGNGNVGINTTSPSYKLDVIGSVRSYSGFTSNGYHGDTYIQNILPAGNNGASTGNVQLRMWCSEPGVTWDWAGFGYNVVNDGTAPYGFARLNSNFGQAYMRFSTDGSMYFYNTTTSNVRTTTMTLSPTGNVGIGVTPSNWSTVTPTLQIGAGGAFIGGQGAANVVRVGVNVYYDGSNWRYINSGTVSWFETASGGFGWFNSASGTAGNVASINQIMTLTASGNLGINTTSPAEKLAVAGNIRAGGNVIASVGLGYGNYISMRHDDNNGYITITRTVYDGNLILEPFANVGISTSSPTEKLHVAGNVVITYNNSFQGINSIGNKAILARVSPTTGIINYAEYATATNLNGFVMGSDDARVKGNIATDSLEFITNGSTQAFIDSSGNVGIGTTSPTQKLDVAGIIRGTSSNPYVIRAKTSSGSNSFISFEDPVNASNDQVYCGSEGNNFIIGTNYAEKLRVNSSGNVGIGTTSISYRVDISGDARILSGSLGVGVAPNATDGRIDASNDIVAYSTSDQRLKENVAPIENALEKVKTLTGVEFDWKEETAHVHGYHGHDVGIIAQDVQAVLPEAVRTNESGYLSVRYEKMIALLIEGMKEQQNQIDELKAKLDGLTK